MKIMNPGRWPRLVVWFISLLSSVAIIYVYAPIHAPVYAHGGGTPRLTNVPVGPYHLYAWSEPEPWRVGEVHLSLAVTMPNPDGDSNQIEIPVTDVDITVTFTPVGNNAGGNSAGDNSAGSDTADSASAPIVVSAVRQEFLSDFYFEADPTLPHAGEWQINVTVMGEEGSGSTEFMMETLPPRAINWTLIASAGGVLLVLLVLIAIWSRAQQTAQPARRLHRGVRRVQRSSSKAQVRKEA